MFGINIETRTEDGFVKINYNTNIKEEDVFGTTN